MTFMNMARRLCSKKVSRSTHVMGWGKLALLGVGAISVELKAPHFLFGGEEGVKKAKSAEEVVPQGFRGATRMRRTFRRERTWEGGWLFGNTIA
jgi:hypothetical protein